MGGPDAPVEKRIRQDKERRYEPHKKQARAFERPREQARQDVDSDGRQVDDMNEADEFFRKPFADETPVLGGMAPDRRTEEIRQTQRGNVNAEGTRVGVCPA